MKKSFLLLSVFAISIIMAQPPSYVPTDGLQAWYPFNGNANDESGNGNNGTVNGATLTTDRFGNINNSYQFIENTDIISISNTTINPQDFTISGWCKLNSPFVYTTFNILEIANIDYTTAGGFGLRMDQNDTFYGIGKYKVYAYSGLSGFGALSSNSLDLNSTSNWNHFVVAKQNGIMSLYINNQLISSILVTGLIDFTNAWLQIGNRKNINNNPLSSRNIDDIGIWNRILTQQEITGLHTTLGDNEIIQNNKITIYPNPAKDQITIDCGNISSVSGWNYTIVNTLGQEVSNGVMNSQQNVVSLNTLNGTGVYLVKIFDAESNLISTKKIIKE
jgi:hypothetical protein